MNNDITTVVKLVVIAVAQFVTIVTLLLVIRELQGRNRELSNERDELRSKLISEIENHTTRINQVGDLARESAQFKFELAQLKEFARECRDNWDHDEDAHKYKTLCRACVAKNLLEGVE